MLNSTRCRHLKVDLHPSIIIVSNKRQILTNVNSCPVKFNLFTTSMKGLGKARNSGASRSGLLVWLDDDLILDARVWEHVLSTPRGEFRMSRLSGFPCSRVMSIHAEDFWNVGGFDENIHVTGEDRDFYVRALSGGLRFREIPHELVLHIPHPARSKNIHVAIRGVKENMMFVAKYWKKYPDVFRMDFLDRLLRLQIRTLLLELILFPYVVWRSRK